MYFLFKKIKTWIIINLFYISSSIKKNLKKSKKPHSSPFMHIDIDSFIMTFPFICINTYLQWLFSFSHLTITIIYILFFSLNYTCDCCVFFFFMQEKVRLCFSFVSFEFFICKYHFLTMPTFYWYFFSLFFSSLSIRYILFCFIFNRISIMRWLLY